MNNDLNRRSWILAGAAAFSGVAVGQGLLFAAKAEGTGHEGGDATRFMTLSALLVPHRLDPVVGRRLEAGLRGHADPMSTHIDALLALARAKNAATVEDFLPFASEPERQSALSIISAWYLGVVDNGPGGEVIAYELALMFQPTRDVTTIPTYAISRPNGWGPAGTDLAAMPVF